MFKQRDADETANYDPARDLQELIKHITSHADIRLFAPMSSSAFGPLTAPRPNRPGQAACGLKAGVGPQLQQPADGPRTQMGPAAGGASRGLRPEPTMRSRRWRSKLVVQVRLVQVRDWLR